MAPELEMYGYWRSQATYRLRVALNLKGIPYHEIPINLDTGEQYSESFRKVNPMGSVPALMVDSDPRQSSNDGDEDNNNNPKEPLTQSLAVLEYLEETHLTPPLLPSDALGRARVRSLSSIAISDSHPLIVPRVREYLKQHADFTPEQWKGWQTHWFTTALRGFEARLKDDKPTGKFCHGDRVTIADICLVGLMQGCKAFGIEVDGIPTVMGIVGRCEGMEAFERARAVHQSDFPGEKK